MGHIKPQASYFYRIIEIHTRYSMKRYRVGVGELVSFLYSSGDLSSETFQNVSLLEGTKAHQYLQSKYQSTDEAEIPISYTFSNDDLEITLSGRIDGILSIDGAL